MSEPLQPGPALGFIYFMIGFVFAAVSTIVALVLLRPLLLTGASEGVLRATLFLPLITGVLFGARVATIGIRERRFLLDALKRGLGLKVD